MLQTLSAFPPPGWPILASLRSPSSFPKAIWSCSCPWFAVLSCEMHTRELWPGIHNCQQEFLWIIDLDTSLKNSMLFIMVIEVIHGLRNQQPDLKSFSVVLSLLIFLLSLLVLFLTGFGFPIPAFPEGCAARSLARDTRATCKLHGVRATQHPARNHSSTAMTNSTSQ